GASTGDGPSAGRVLRVRGKRLPLRKERMDRCRFAVRPSRMDGWMVELAGLEPATSWVRTVRGGVHQSAHEFGGFAVAQPLLAGVGGSSSGGPVCEGVAGCRKVAVKACESLLDDRRRRLVVM